MKKNIPQKGIIRIGDISAGTFFKITVKKLAIDLFISILFVYIFFSVVPWANQVYIKEAFFARITDIVTNTLVYMLLFYSLSCYICLVLFKSERLK